MKKFFGCLFLFTLLISFVSANEPEANVKTSPVKIIQLGVIESTLHYFPKKFRKVVLAPVSSLVANATGVACKPCTVADPMKSGRLLESGELHVAMLNGFEFAWVQEKYPKIKPIAITIVGKRVRPQACLVTLKESAIGCFSDLTGKSLSLPIGSRPHVRFFLQRERNKRKDCSFTIHEHPSIIDALDDVILKKVDSVLVDAAALDNYKLIKPGCHSRLKIAQTSVSFPAGVLAYREGKLSSETVARFRKGLLAAHEDVKNQILMSLWRVSSFGQVPDDYLEAVRRIRELYPRE